MVKQDFMNIFIFTLNFVTVYKVLRVALINYKYTIYFKRNL